MGQCSALHSAYEDENRAQSPIVTRFFSGGGTSMRGFNSQRLSPESPSSRKRETLRRPLPSPQSSPLSRWAATTLFETSLEVRYRLTESLVIATFWDTGSVGCNGESSDCYVPLRAPLYHALGLGLRYLTVVGPVRLDVARRLKIGPPLLEETGGYTYPASGTCFGLGRKMTRYAGAPDGLCTLQLSIGEAF